MSCNLYSKLRGFVFHLVNWKYGHVCNSRIYSYVEAANTLLSYPLCKAVY